MKLNYHDMPYFLMCIYIVLPRNYLTSDQLPYAVNRALATMGNNLVINFKEHAALFC